MNIGLDYDGVVTEDFRLFMQFAIIARKAGHKIYLVTMRYPSECEGFKVTYDRYLDGVYATSRMAKKPFMENLGINIHVWIDDNPRAINEDAINIWPVPAPEGRPVVPTHSG